jgi:peptidoglycan hydrolase-like protein with peptidoglycan-binding domain
MTKYFNYEDAGAGNEPETPEFGHRTLAMGDTGDDVKVLQESLIALGYSCGKWGADGEFGKATRNAVMAFQQDASLAVNGVVGPETVAAINALLPESGGDPDEAPAEAPAQLVEITGGTVWVRTQPSTGGATLGIVRKGDKLKYRGEKSESGWLAVALDDEDGWVSGKYAEVIQ